MFEDIVGHAGVKAYLEKAIKQKRLAQTLLFSGRSGIGKSLVAKAVAKTLLGSEKSPDLSILKPEGKVGLYAIETLREMIAKEHEASFEGKGKVFILEDADRMAAPSANILLKTLEEPSDETTFILITSKPQEMLPTIVSRCSQLSFQPLAESEIETVLEQKKIDRRFAKLGAGSLGKALEWASYPNLAEEQKILFSILANRPSYPELHIALAKLEELLDSEKEEDPLQSAAHVEDLFASIWMWHRDQHVRKIGGASLFFPDEPQRESIPLQEVEKAIERGRLAYRRNMKISICFLAVFLTSPAWS